MKEEEVRAVIREFLKPYFPKETYAKPIQSEEESIGNIVKYVADMISSNRRPTKYVLGLALDFAMLAQQLAHFDRDAISPRPSLDEKSLFSRYELVVKRGKQAANTLTLKFDKQQAGIRKIEESVVQLFHSLNRTGYPTAYVYNTGQWPKFRELLLLCFRLSENGRYWLCCQLVTLGTRVFPENKFYGRQKPRVRLFEKILMDYERVDRQENAGMAFQAIAHAFVAVDRPHLRIVADRVRTGSSRQKRFGDIDCYFGLDLELSVEVKDIEVKAGNLTRELGGFVKKIESSGVLGLVFVADIDGQSLQYLREKHIAVLTIELVLAIVRTWDWQKQEYAAHAVLHHFAHVEQNALATLRLLRFIREVDSAHSSLVASAAMEQSVSSSPAAAEPR